MHTIDESNCTVTKLPRSGNSKAKKINKRNKTIQFIEVIKHSERVDAYDNFCTDHPPVD